MQVKVLKVYPGALSTGAQGAQGATGQVVELVLKVHTGFQGNLVATAATGAVGATGSRCSRCFKVTGKQEYHQGSWFYGATGAQLCKLDGTGDGNVDNGAQDCRDRVYYWC